MNALETQGRLHGRVKRPPGKLSELGKAGAAESKQSMLRTASSIQSRSSIMLTASSTGSTRPAQGAIAAFYLPSKKHTPRRKQGMS